MSAVQMKRLFAGLALCASALAIAQSDHATPQRGQTHASAPVLLATAGAAGRTDALAASAQQLSFADARAAEARDTDPGKDGASRDWVMMAVGIFLIVAITGRRARTMFD